MNNHNYNTTRPPIILKRYGRNIQNLVKQISTIQDPHKRNQYAENLIPILQNLNSSKNKKDTNTAALWSDLYIMSEYKIQITPPCQIPNNTPLPPPKTQNTSYRPTPKNKFKCCGHILTQFIQKVLNTLTSDPQKQKKHITALINMVQQYHKKRDSLTSILHHIEEISQKKLPLTHEEILAWFPEKNNKYKPKQAKNLTKTH